MKFYRYWALESAKATVDGRDRNISCHGGSNESLDDAKRNAKRIAERTASAVAGGSPREAYSYIENGFREEIVDEITSDGVQLAVTTRNGYGSLVLNCATVLFADVDYPATSFLSGLKKRWFGRGVSNDDEIIGRVHRLVESKPGLGLKLYRTANGFRCLVTSQTFDPKSSEATAILEALGSDPLYIKLCRAQECFRARLTPKHWRCDFPAPPKRIPWLTTEQERTYRDWEAGYLKAISGYSTCAFVGDFGSVTPEPFIQEIVDLHEMLSCQGDLPLA
jgi:hypothetical protein